MVRPRSFPASPEELQGERLGSFNSNTKARHTLPALCSTLWESCGWQQGTLLSNRCLVRCSEYWNHDSFVSLMWTPAILRFTAHNVQPPWRPRIISLTRGSSTKRFLGQRFIKMGSEDELIISSLLSSPLQVCLLASPWRKWHCLWNNKMFVI